MVTGGCSNQTAPSRLRDILQSAQTELKNNKLDEAQDHSSQALAECKSWKAPLTEEQVALKNQTLQVLEDVAKKNAEMGRLETAMTIYQKALDLNRTDESPDHRHTLEVAVADIKSRQTMEASLILAAKPKITSSRKDSQHFWDQLMEIERLKSAGSLTQAVKRAEDLFKQVSSDTGSPVPEHIGALNMIIRVYDQQNRQHEIIEILERTLRDHPASADGTRAGKFNEYDDAMIHAHALSQMASILTKQHKDAEAEAYARKSLALQEFYHNELSDNYAISLSQLAGILTELHTRPDEVVRLRYKSNGIFARLNRSTLAEAVCNKVDLANCLCMMSRWSEACKLYEEVIPLRDKFPQFVPTGALGRSVSAYLALHNDQKAITQEQLFLSEAKKAKLTNGQIASAMLDWAEVASTYQNFDLSTKYYKEVMTLLASADSQEGREHYAMAVAGLGLTELQTNKPSQAEKHFQKALQLFRKMRPMIHFAGALNSAAALEVNKGNFEQALACNREALKICTAVLGEAAEPTISTKNQMAIALFKQEKYQDALDLCRSAEHDAMKAKLKSTKASEYGRKASFDFTCSMYIQLVYSTLNQSRSLLALHKKIESIEQIERSAKFLKSAIALEPESNYSAIFVAIGKQYFAVGMKANGLEMYQAAIADAKRLHIATKEIEQELRSIQASPDNIKW